jgi:hypothetical protein
MMSTSMAPQSLVRSAPLLPVVRKPMSLSISAGFPCRIDQHERLKSSLTAAGPVWRQENHADKLREGRDEVNEYEGEERPEAIPDRKVDRLERHRHCGNESYSVEEELVHRLHVSAGK